ncbi:MAG: anaerobic sulfatase maturase [Chloroflexota bacterium]
MSLSTSNAIELIAQEMAQADLRLAEQPVVDNGLKPPPAFGLMTKPRGAICNLDCKYCYFLSKEYLYPDSQFRMSTSLLELYIQQYIEAQQVDEVTFAWQGGEPTLIGLDFFKQAIAFQQKYSKPGMRIYNALQTNGTLINDEWASFFAQHDFLIGLSIDGPKAMHDHYRVDKGGRPTFDTVIRGLDYLKKHQVEFNILTTLHAGNADFPLEIYRYFRDNLGAQFMQFIPIVERANQTGFQEGDQVTERSISAKQYGDFLTTIFDEWVRRDVGQVYVQIFDVALGVWSGRAAGLCIFRETCGNALALEHNGDLFSCDHFVEPAFKLGNIQDVPMIKLVASEKQRRFGDEKRDALPQHCLDCEVKFMCNGGCPKNRFVETPAGEPGLNYLCTGYRAFFNHIDKPMRFMTQQIQRGQAPATIIRYLNQQEQVYRQQFESAKRNDPCPCHSGKKFKQCHARQNMTMQLPISEAFKQFEVL